MTCARVCSSYATCLQSNAATNPAGYFTVSNALGTQMRYVNPVVPGAMPSTAAALLD